jgi:mannose-1-phosphate guanylyltransferase/mannose-1-phosphate guanylyltransferase/mannose-6-phosphate isomerase
MKITPVILSGGGGTRLWPLSTSARPKQFLALTGDATMFEMTLARVKDRGCFSAPVIVASAAHDALVRAQLANAGLAEATIIYEPCARNTAPAIALAAMALDDVKAPMLVMPSDHVISDAVAFNEAIKAALPFANEGWLVTFGIAPTGPETGYGYIRMGAELGGKVRQVEHFVEKPELDRAAAMLAAGDHSWNGGIFLFRADIYLDALASHAPDILAAVQKAMANGERDQDRITPDAEAFAACPADSIDYAVMEKTSRDATGRVAVVPVSMGWSDIGSWDALYALRGKDGAGNGNVGMVRLSEAKGNLVHAEGIRISIHGVNDLIVVANGKEVMIVPRGSSQIVRQFAGG